MSRRAIPFVGLMAVAAAVVIVVAALTTWWVLLALMPLMMVACMAMMSAMTSMMGAWRPERWGRMMGFDGWRGRRRETPSEILERRFAEGAISVEEFQERREVIESQSRRRQGTGPRE